MRKTKSAIFEAVHDTAKGLRQEGGMDEITLRELDPGDGHPLVGERHFLILAV